MKIICAHCGKSSDKPNGAVNRAINGGHPLYCNKICSGLGRRKPEKPDEVRRAEKSEYDKVYRDKNLERIKAEKAEYYRLNHDREKEKEYRKKRMPKHVEYCQRPEYVEYKREYDRQHRAKEYGEYAECYLLALDLRRACLEKLTDYEIRLEKGTLSKSQQRKRDYERTKRKDPEAGPLGNLEQHQRR